MTIITLTSDFGLADGYVGIMKGVILHIAPQVRLVDLSHDVARQNVRQAAYVLSQAAPYFEPGTVHLAVVDPGVGTERRPLLVRTPQATFVGPDNGLFTAFLGGPGVEVFTLNRSAYWLPSVSSTFHGRDIFAPVAAHAAQGTAAEEMGGQIDDPVRLAWQGPERRSGGPITGQIVYVDRFGNLITNVPADWLAGDEWQCQIAGHLVPHLSAAYASVEYGALCALVSSGDTLEIAVREGDAAARLGARPGDPVTLYRQESDTSPLPDL